MGPFEVVHLVSLTAGLMAIVAHMNNMTLANTTKFEAGAWWALGVGYFGEWFWQIYCLSKGVPYYTPGEHVLTSVGITCLLIVQARPEWRPLFADRRKRLIPVPNNLRRQK